MLKRLLTLTLVLAVQAHAEQLPLPYAYCMALLNVIGASGATDAPDMSVLGHAQRQLNRLSVTFREHLDRRAERPWTHEPFRFEIKDTYELVARDIPRYRELKRRMSTLHKDLANPDRVDQNLTKIFIGRDAVLETVAGLPRAVENIDEDLLARLGAQHPDTLRRRERQARLDMAMGLGPLLILPGAALAYHQTSALGAALATGVLAGAAAYLKLNPWNSIEQILRLRQTDGLGRIDGDRQASREEAAFYGNLLFHMQIADKYPNGFFAFGTHTKINSWDKFIVDVGNGQTEERALGDPNFPYAKYSVDLDRIGFYDQFLHEPVLILTARIRRD